MSNSTDFNEELDGYKKIDQYNPVQVDRIAAHYTDILSALGEDPNREGLLKTPERVAKALQFLTHGYDINAAEVLKSAMFEEDYSQMVVVKDIEVYSMCEHHMLPFFGKAHIPNLCLWTFFGRILPKNILKKLWRNTPKETAASAEFDLF